MSAVETWRISRGKAACCACGKEFQPNQGLFSALREEGEEFLRHDFCPSCWPAQQEASFFCHWRTRRAQPEQRHALDTGLMLEFFDRLEGADAANKKVFRFVVALYLMRRKELKLLGPERTDERELPRSGGTHPFFQIPLRREGTRKRPLEFRAAGAGSSDALRAASDERPRDRCRCR